jgi:hypothetical protein
MGRATIPHARTKIHHAVARDQAALERAQFLYEIANAY